MTEIFVSYSNKDAVRVQRLIEKLKDLGFSIWSDVDVRAGERFTSSIQQALQVSKAVIVVWTKHSIESEWVYEEADFAKRRNKLVPIFLDDCDPPLGFGLRQGARLINWEGNADHQWENLLKSLEPLVGKPAASEDVALHAVPKATRGSPEGEPKGRGKDLRYDLSISLEEAFEGSLVDVKVYDASRGERILKVNIPRGIESGTRIRLGGEGAVDISGDLPGDLYIHMEVAEHPIFVRRGRDLLSREAISVTTAALGGTADVRLIDGGIARVQVPRGTQTGKQLRLKGRGMVDLQGGRGDHYVELVVETPTDLDERAEGMMKRLRRFLN